ncbi:MAG: hypothetical protein BMS9Abin01_0526 [Gammaproteobacteria bacterium]|nr:MAG: hypothetical protein BMS9Abin01_0526 [Gammaproteobacteria bacterium]
MRPRIRYATAADGARIAFWSLGEGRPLIYMTGGPWSHMELWDIPECRQWYERLSADRQVVRYDMRGTGLSQRDVADFSLEVQLGDVEAVVETLAVPSFDLFAATDAGPVAIAYTAHHPEQVTRLALWCGCGDAW